MAAGNTYIPIATNTASGSQSVITFLSITQIYTDLVFVNVPGYTEDGYINLMRFNSDSGNNYSHTRLRGTGSVANSSRQSNISYAHGGWAATTFPVNIIHINNYSNTTTYKTILTRSGYSSGNVAAFVSLWRDTAAISNITFTHESGFNFTAGSTFTLYGIAAA